MDQENRMKIYYKIAVVSGIFCGVVALLLLLNFWNMKRSEPLESKTIEVLVERLKQEPNNEELKEEIRSFDLLARKAYFTSRWQVRTGTWLLLFGGIVLGFSLKRYTDIRARILPPEGNMEDVLKARANAQYWLLVTGGLVLGLALFAALMTNDYLADYREMAAAGTTETVEPVRDAAPGVEVVDVLAGEAAPQQEETAAQPEETSPQPELATDDAGEGTTAEPATETAAAPQAKPGAFNPEDFKKNQANFRGFMGHGISYHKNLPTSWNGASGEKVKWKVALSKPGYNTPVIWDDKIFVAGADGAARMLMCFERNTGRLLWEKTVTGIAGSPTAMPRVTEDTGLAAPTMATDGNRVYVIFATGDVAAYDMAGNMSWGRNLGVPGNHYGHSSSLQLWETKLIVQYDTHTGGRLLALDTGSGETIWDVQRPVGISWASPVMVESEGKMQVVTTADPYVMGNDLETGAEIWKVEAMMGEVGPSVAYSDGVVFACNEYARLVAVEPKAGAEILWESDEYLSEASSPVAYKGLLWVPTSYGVLACYDTKTGEMVYEKEFGEGFYSSPMIAEDRLYLIDLGGTTHIMKTDRSGTIIAQPKLGEKGFALPVFADGVVYLRANKNLYCIEK